MELRAHRFHTTRFLTSRSGDAERLTREAISGEADIVIAVGGDGTVNEVVNGFFDGTAITDEARLALLPAGTGMDFARNVGARRGVRHALRRLLAGNETRVDVGLAHARGRVFVNFAETGLGAAVVAREKELGPSWPGRASFLVAAIGAALEEPNIDVRIIIDGSPAYAGPVVSVVAANGRYFGGGMKIAPHAHMDDGYFDVFVLGDFTRLELLSQIWKIYPGVHIGHRKVLWQRGRTIEIQPVQPALLDLDGELQPSGPMDLSLLPRALRVLV